MSLDVLFSYFRMGCCWRAIVAIGLSCLALGSELELESEALAFEVDADGRSSDAQSPPSLPKDHIDAGECSAKKPKKKKDHIKQFRRDYETEWKRQNEKHCDLPDNDAVFDLNKCAICEASAFIGSEALIRWLAKAKARQEHRQQSSRKAKRRGGSGSDAGPSVMDLIDDIEATCNDREAWMKRYRQQVGRA